MIDFFLYLENMKYITAELLVIAGYFNSYKSAMRKLSILRKQNILEAHNLYFGKRGRQRIVCTFTKKYLQNYSRRHKKIIVPNRILHALEINRFFSLVMRNLREPYSFIYLPEHTLQVQRKAFFLISGQNYCYTDGIMSITNNNTNKKALFTIEIDLGTEPLCIIRSKLEIYSLFNNSQEFRKYSEYFDYSFKGYRLLFVTKNQLRMDKIREFSPPNVWLTTIDKIENILEPIWKVPGEDKLKKILREEV